MQAKHENPVNNEHSNQLSLLVIILVFSITNQIII